MLAMNLPDFKGLNLSSRSNKSLYWVYHGQFVCQSQKLDLRSPCAVWNCRWFSRTSRTHLTLSWSMVVEDTKEYACKSWHSLSHRYSIKGIQYMWSWTAIPLGQIQSDCSILGMVARWSWKSEHINSPFSVCYASTAPSFLLGGKFAIMQDHLICIAHHLARLTYNFQFY